MGIIDKYGGGGCYIGKAVVVHIDFFTMPCDMQTVAEKRLGTDAKKLVGLLNSDSIVATEIVPISTFVCSLPL